MMRLNPQQEAVANAPATQSLKVIAGAGTGKTETLKERFLRLTEDSWERAECILCLTFTEKAAGEMRERIEAALPPNEGLLRPPLWLHTFHGFCQRILGEFAYEAGLSPGFQVVDDLASEALIAHLCDSILHGEYDREGPLGAATLAGLRLSAPDAMLRSVMGFVTKAKSLGWSPEELQAHALDKCERFFAALPTPTDVAADDRDLLQAQLASAFTWALGIGGTPCEERTSVTDLRTLYRENAKSPPYDTATWQRARDRERQEEQTVIAATVAAYREYQALLRAENALDFSDLIIEAIKLLKGHETVRRQLEERFVAIMVDEFQDTTPAQMELLKFLTRQAPCDQATCPQCRPGNGRDPNACVMHTNLMIVGDKKQSIYGFLHVRPENVDDLIPCDAPPVRYDLIINYRSAGAVVSLGNRVKAEAEFDDTDLQPHDAAAFIDAHHPDPEGQPQPEGCSLCGRLAHASDTPSVAVTAAFVGANVGEARASESSWIASEIVRLCREEGYRQGDIAVLVSRNARFAALKKAFTDAKVAYVPVGGVGFFEESLVRDVLAYLKVVEDRFDGMSLTRILTRPPYSLTHRQLYILASQVRLAPTSEDVDPPSDERLQRLDIFETLADLAEEPHRVFTGERAALLAELPVSELSDLGKLLTDLHAGRFGMSPSAMIEAILDKTQLLRDVLPADRTTAAIALGILRHLAAALEARRLNATVRDFLDLLQTYHDAPKSMPTPDVEGGDAVRVMTVHKAKGLEFPVVFLPSVVTSGRGGGDWVYDEKMGLVLGNVRGQRCAKRAVYYALSGEHIQREREDLRLFYVGATRAMKRLVTSYTAGSRAKVTGPEGHPYARFFADDERLETPETPDPLPELGEGAGAVGLTEPRIIELLAAPSDGERLLRTSFSELMLLEDCPLRFWIKRRWGMPWAAPASAVTTASDEEHDTDATSVGTAFHGLVAEFYAAPWDAAQDADRVALAAEQAGMDRAGAEHLARLFAAFRGSDWAQVHPAPEDVERGVRLCLSVEGQPAIVSGKIDLARRDGGVKIADFKTNVRLSEADVARYGLQQYIYARALAVEAGAGPDAYAAVLVHVSPGGCRDIRPDLSGCEARLTGLLTRAAELEALAGMPEPGPTPPCEGCHYRDLCPRSTQR